MTDQLKHILCVDDEPSILEVAKMSLESIGGYQVTTLSNGKEAVERANDLKPDLVLLDVMMPGMDGPTTYAQLKNIPALRNKPFVFMTAKVQPKEVASYIGLGATGVIIKPFDPMKISEEVQTYWKNYQDRQ